MPRIDRSHPEGPRLWIGRRRIHHWHAGATLILLGVRLMWVDRTDLVNR